MTSSCLEPKHWLRRSGASERGCGRMTAWSEHDSPLRGPQAGSGLRSAADLRVRDEMPAEGRPPDGARPQVDVSIIMPCLNEAGCLPACIANAREALLLMRQSYGLSGEIVIADNGSTDGSPTIAVALGARCVHV